MRWRKLGLIWIFSSVDSQYQSGVVFNFYFYSFFLFLFLFCLNTSIFRMHLNPSDAVQDSNSDLTVTGGSFFGKYNRPFSRDVGWVSGGKWTVFSKLLPGSVLGLSAWRACEWVLVQHICRWTVENGGKEDENGLIKCYSGLLWYSHYLSHRSGCAVTTCSPHSKQASKLFPLHLATFLHMPLANWNIGKTGWKITLNKHRSGFPSRSDRSNE